MTYRNAARKKSLEEFARAEVSAAAGVSEFYLARRDVARHSSVRARVFVTERIFKKAARFSPARKKFRRSPRELTEPASAESKSGAA